MKFDEVFGEPDEAHSIDCVWRCSYKCFNTVLGCCYKVLTVLCALPLAFCWAISFACTACYHVWYLTPYINCCTMNMGPYRKLLELVLQAFVAPVIETCGLCFSKIVVKNG